MDVRERVLPGRAVANHWYYRSKQMALDTMLKGVRYRNILDIGAGSAVFARHLIESGAESAVCVDSAYPDERIELVGGRPIRYIRDMVPCDADLVLLMDVLEHVDDDAGLIRRSVSGAASGTLVLISVPAFQFLFSAHDRFLEHRRRYTIRSLESVVAAAGLEVVRSRYFFALVLPLAAAIRIWQRNGVPKSSLTTHSGFINGLLIYLHRAELPLFRRNRLAGLSIFCLARSP